VTREVDYAVSMAVYEAVGERRGGYDRRRLSARSFFQGGLTPRRRSGRRAGETDGFVDWHEPHLLFLSLTILLLSVADAFLTLTLLTQGAREVNPVMAYVLEHYPAMFGMAKMILTGGALLVLVAMARATVFRLIRVSTVMHWFLIGYVSLIAYEWWLLRNIF